MKKIITLLIVLILALPNFVGAQFLVNSGGTGTSTIGTGRIPFGGVSPTLRINHTEDFIWNNTLKYLGLGTTTPGTSLSIGNTGNNTINISSTATSTFGSGINLRTGCFAVNGVCAGTGSGTVGSGTIGQFPYYASNGTTLTATSTVFVDTASEVGIGTVSPSAKLHVYQASNGEALRIEQNAGGRTMLIDSSGMSFNTVVAVGKENVWEGNGALEVKTATAGRVGVWVRGEAAQSAAMFRGVNSSNVTLNELKADGGGYFSGNVGIATTSPYSLLSVAGQAVAQNYVATSTTATSTFNNAIFNNQNVAKVTIGSAPSFEGFPGIWLTNAAPTISNYAFLLDPGANTILNTPSGTNFAFRINNSTQMIMDSNGRIGIGTTTPTWLLNPSSATASQLALSSGAGVAQWAFRNAGGNFYLSTTTVAGTATTTVAALSILTSSGNVGIGKNIPTVKLDVLGKGIFTPTAASQDTIRVNTSTGSRAVQLGTLAGFESFGGVCFGDVTCGITNYSFASNGSNQTLFNTDTGGSIEFRIGNGASPSAMKIASDGNFGIASGTPWRKLSVVGTMAVNGLTSATGGTNRVVCIHATTKDFIEETTGACTVSSRKFKNSIQDLTVNAIELLSKLRPVSYSPNDDDSADFKDVQYGFIAEEVADVSPHFAKYGTDGLPRTLDDRGMLSVVVKAVQDMWQKVESHESRIEKLERENVELLKRIEKLEQ